MQGNSSTIANILNASSAYRVPPYQRAYQWEADRWQGLAHDVYQLTSKPKNEPPHWLGILLLSEESGITFPGDDSVRLYTVIDGQQRITTTILWLAAIAHHAKDLGTPLKLDVSRFAQVEVQEIDKLPFTVAIEGKWRTAKFGRLLTTRPLQAYAYFRWLLHLGNDALIEEEPVKGKLLLPAKEAGPFEEQWQRFLDSKSGESIPRGTAVDCELLARTTRTEMSIFALIHDPKLDESQATIFDTLNGMRTPLEPLDHVRNSLFVRLSEDKAKTLYESQWKDTENAIRRMRMKRMAAEKLFLYDYLIAAGEKGRQKTLNANRGASHFSVMTRGLSGDKLESLISGDLLPAMAAWPIVVRQSTEYRLGGVQQQIPKAVINRLATIQDLSVNPANPVALHFLALYAQGAISQKDLEESLFYTECYLARQMLCGRSLSPLRSRVMDIMAKLDRSHDPQVLLATFMASSEWAADPDIEKVARERPFYSDLPSPAVLALLRGIERELSGSGAMYFESGEYSVEHIFPQRHSKWVNDLSAWGADTHQMSLKLHTIGNLAAVTKSHNAAVGNSTFGEKQKYPIKPGKAAPLSINAGWLKASQWTEVEIEARSKELVAAGLKRWSPPSPQASDTAVD